MSESIKKVLDLTKLQVGDIILVHTPFNLWQPLTWLSWLIRFFTKDYYNHAAIVGYSNSPIVIPINPFYPSMYTDVQSVESGVISDPLSTQISGCDIKIRRYDKLMSPTNDQLNQLVTRINSFRGIPYDIPGCLIFQLIKQLGNDVFPGSDIWLEQHQKDGAKRFYCSELVACCLKLPNWWELSPADLDVHINLSTIYEGIVIFS